MGNIEQAKEKLIEGIERADSPEREIMQEVLALLEQAEPSAKAEPNSGYTLLDRFKETTDGKKMKCPVHPGFGPLCGKGWHRPDCPNLNAEPPEPVRRKIENLQNCMMALWSENKARAEQYEKLCVENGILWAKNETYAGEIKRLGKFVELYRAKRNVDGMNGRV